MPSQNSWAFLERARARLAAESGTLRKESPLRVALVYPSPYPIAMSSLGFQTIYRRIHAHPGATAERAFLPDDLAAFRQARLPLFTYESERPVSSADLVAFSLAYELELPGLLECLALSGLPLRAEERGPQDPLVIVGGPLTFSNPLPAAPFADVIVLGEAEETLQMLLATCQEEPSRARRLASS